MQISTTLHTWVLSLNKTENWDCKHLYGAASTMTDSGTWATCGGREDWRKTKNGNRGICSNAYFTVPLRGKGTRNSCCQLHLCPYHTHRQLIPPPHHLVPVCTRHRLISALYWTTSIHTGTPKTGNEGTETSGFPKKKFPSTQHKIWKTHLG